jgi:hypothetical protein
VPHRPELADQLCQPPDQRVIPVVHGLHDDQAGGRRGVRDLRRLLRALDANGFSHSTCFPASIA